MLSSGHDGSDANDKNGDERRASIALLLLAFTFARFQLVFTRRELTSVAGLLQSSYRDRTRRGVITRKAAVL